jgi:RNA polymerase sigma-70 factor (ECF subfamily)
VFDPTAGNLRGWLIRIARNRTIDRLRADARRPRTARVAVGSEDDDNPLAALDRADPSTDDPERAFERGWTRAVVRTALTSVPPDERELLVLAYADGLSQSEIADRLGIPIGTVKSRTRRAMARLRDTLSSVPELTGQWQRMDV